MTSLTVDPAGCSLLVVIEESKEGVIISYDPLDSLWPQDSAEQRLLELLEGYIVSELPSGEPGSGEKRFLTNLVQEDELSEILISNGIAA